MIDRDDEFSPLAPALRNASYVKARCDDAREALRAAPIASVPLVYDRRLAGEATALDNRCPHRRFPLSRGWEINDRVQTTIDADTLLGPVKHHTPTEPSGLRVRRMLSHLPEDEAATEAELVAP